MNYRTLGRTGLKVSEVGFGGEHIENTPAENVEAVVRTALEGGVNIMDVFMPGEAIRTDMGNILRGRRQEVVLQGHIGAVLRDGQYARSRAPIECGQFVKDFLTRFHTDYIDIGMIHFVDTAQDWRECFESPYIEFVRRLKAEGVIRFIGASSHNPETARRMVETGLIDVLMFSINPAFDMLPADMVLDDMFADKTYEAKRFSLDPKRAELYRLCEEQGVGITVMKSLAASRLLHADASSFGFALTPVQCIHYALERPAVASVLMGAKTPEQMTASLAYVNATAEERDYTVIANGRHSALSGQCMYCNHCLPCPSNIDIAAVTKYLDMARQAGLTGTLKAHYEAFEAHASDCVACGSCEVNCPFGVGVIANMREAAMLFGV
jgi:predicted aldo/keto reductase-like oxidoreductase